MSAYARWLGALTAMIVGVGTAAAEIPSTTYLSPDSFTKNLNEPVHVHIDVGARQNTSVSPWPADQLKWFFVRAEGTQANRDTIQATDRDKNIAVVTISRPGVTMIGFDYKPAIKVLPGTDLALFLAQNVTGADADPAVLQLMPRRVRVRRIESATTMIRVPAKDGQIHSSAIALSKTGLSAEIRPMFDPTILSVGSDLPVKIYVPAAKKVSIKVQATTVEGNKTVEKTTDATGATYFRITHPGKWRLEFHHAQKLENDAAADWMIHSGTLTFEVPSAGDGK